MPGTPRSSIASDALLAIYDFPAEHWNLRTSHPIESTFATVRRRSPGPMFKDGLEVIETADRQPKAAA